MALDGDVLTKILGNVDSKTLVNAACVSSHFSSIASQECLWEDACFMRWPSTQNPQLKNFISSSLGGFRKFYANCFSGIASDEAFHTNSTFNDHDVCSLEADTTSHFMWVVDVQYNNKPIFSKIVWGAPHAAHFAEWYLQSPFQIDIINLEDGLPTIMSYDEVGKEGLPTIWRQLMENIKMSWIVINKRTGEAANLSSWAPLGGQTHPKSKLNFVVRFGSLLPAVEILPFKVVKCVVEMKGRISASDDQTSLKMSEVSVRLEDMNGNDVNGRKGLGILERALRYRRSDGHKEVLELQRKCLTGGRNSKEANIPTERHPRNVWITSYIIACVSFYYLKSLLGIMLAKD